VNYTFNMLISACGSVDKILFYHIEPLPAITPRSMGRVH